MRHRALVFPILLVSLATVLAACGGGGHGGSDPVMVRVTSLADSGPGSLRQVVLDAPPGATVVFDPALAGGQVNLVSWIDIEKPVLIDGSVPGDDITIDGNNATRLFLIEASGAVELRNLILQRGASTGDGGIIAVEGDSLRLDHVLLLGGFADGYGGAIFAAQSDLEMVG